MINELITALNGNPVLVLTLLTLIPFLELRASIPYGILVLKLPWWWVFLVCVITNILLGPVLYFLLDNFVHIFLKIGMFAKLYAKYVEKTQAKLQKYVDKYGELGVAIFIGVPLPGSGTYSAALGSYIIGLGMKRFIIANIIGVIVAGALVTIITITGGGIFSFLIKVL